MALQFRDDNDSIFACFGMGVARWDGDKGRWVICEKQAALDATEYRLINDTEAAAFYPDANFTDVPVNAIAQASGIMEATVYGMMTEDAANFRLNEINEALFA